MEDVNNICKFMCCEGGEELYLLDAKITWESHELLSEHCSLIINNYTLATVLKEVVVKIEPCQLVGISTMKSFPNAENVNKHPRVTVPCEDGTMVYSLSCQNTWESAENKITSHVAFAVEDNALSIPIKDKEIKLVSCDIFKEVNDLPLTVIRQDDLIEGKADIKQGDLNEGEADIYCSELSELLNDQTENLVAYNENNYVNESGNYSGKHTTPAINSCNIFGQGEKVTSHMIKCDVKKKYECSICSRRFSQNGHLKDHMVVHTGLKKYECDWCRKKFTKHCSLRRHMTTHTGIKDYECNICSRRFSQKGHLKDHMVVHTGLKKYECDQCGKKFTLGSSLKKHTQRIHAEVETYECDQCGMEFTWRSNLEKHMGTHAGEGKYNSEVSGEQFSLFSM